MVHFANTGGKVDERDEMVVARSFFSRRQYSEITYISVETPKISNQAKNERR